MAALDDAAKFVCAEAQGAQFAYCQSDEISILLTDFTKEDTGAWFDGNLQKICSVSASIAAMAFNGHAAFMGKFPNATFDARVFTIPDNVEVANYFVWRQKDAERNSVQMLAQHYASHKELHKKPIPEQHDIIHNGGDNWNDHPWQFKRGRVVKRLEFTGEIRDSNWAVVETPVFTKDREWLKNLIPIPWAEKETETA